MLTLQRQVGNSALSRTLQRALREDTSSPGARTADSADGGGTVVTLDDLIGRVLAHEPRLTGIKDRMEARLKHYGGAGPPDFVFGSAAAVVLWLRREGIGPPVKDEEKAEEGAEGETYDAAFEAALLAFQKATRNMNFSGSSSQPFFDEACWKLTLVVTWEEDGPQERIPYENPRKWSEIASRSDEIDLEYTLVGGVSPSLAIREIARHPERWAMDCIDYVIAARLYAECRAAGDEWFDAKYSSLGKELEPAPMRMAQHGTPGITSGAFWEREGQGDEFESDKEPKRTGAAPRNAVEEDVLLASVPIGARVMWTTDNPKAHDDMGNENTIKIGPDLYAAHPLGRLSGYKVRKALAVGDDKDADIAQNIYLSEIDFYTRT
ncbi:MAG: hypothetical protein QOE31_3214 [Solirubrobacteraceae bacterium]|nr:hypothetical protein [Solirubrobacteraceae bacterium]